MLGVAAHRQLPAGRHHLAGTYDGSAIKLYIDGELVAARQGSGQIIDCQLPVILGKIQDGQAQFRGRIEAVRISNRAITEGEIRSSAKG